MQGRISKWILIVILLIVVCSITALFVFRPQITILDKSRVESPSAESKPEEILSTSKPPMNYQERLELIVKNRNQGNRKEAIRLEQECLRMDPKNAEILIILAEDYLWEGMLYLAERTVKKAIEIAPDSSYGMRVLAEIYLLQAKKESITDPEEGDNKLNLAKTAIEKAIDLAPDDAWVSARAAEIYLALDKKDEARVFINKSLEFDPKNKIFQEIKKQINSSR